MSRYTRIITVSIFTLAAFAVVSACTVKETKLKEAETNQTALAAPYSTGISITPADDENCPGGGNAYTIYTDLNSNGVIDPQEPILNTQLVCNGKNGTNGANGANGSNGSNGANGANGANGFSTLFSMKRVTTSYSACASETGLQIDSGLDLDRSAALDASEITATQILCDGAKGENGEDGAVGAAGPAGSNGYSMVFQTTPSSGDICPAGGVNILMSLDTNRNGHFDTSDASPQSLTICNGVNGENGKDGENGKNGKDGKVAELPAYTPIDVISLCGTNRAYPEVLLRLNNGQVLSSFSASTAGAMTRLVILPDGNYMTTDGSSCAFQLTTETLPNEKTKQRSISWSGKVQKSWMINY